MTQAAGSARTAGPTLCGTVVFTDLAGFTEFTALRGDIEAVALLALQEKIVRDTLPPDARLVKELGDGMLLWFPDAPAAVDAALAIQEQFNQAADESDLPLAVRVGMHAGRQVARGADVVGHDVNVAARIVATAAPGEVLLSAATRDEVGDRCRHVCFERLGPVVMRGIPDPIPLFRAERASPGEEEQ